tara:strand:- start:33 stop:260 length:228 start_codon:yes stop_codon:yes gene_type:complete
MKRAIKSNPQGEQTMRLNTFDVTRITVRDTVHDDFNVKKMTIFHNEGVFELNMFSDTLETLTFEYQPVNNAKENN